MTMGSVGWVGGAGLHAVLNLALQAQAALAAPSSGSPKPTDSLPQGGLVWILGINLVIWTGLFLYLLRLGRRLRDMEKGQ